MVDLYDLSSSIIVPRSYSALYLILALCLDNFYLPMNCSAVWKLYVLHLSIAIFKYATTISTGIIIGPFLYREPRNSLIATSRATETESIL